MHPSQHRAIGERVESILLERYQRSPESHPVNGWVIVHFGRRCYAGIIVRHGWGQYDSKYRVELCAGLVRRIVTRG